MGIECNISVSMHVRAAPMAKEDDDFGSVLAFNEQSVEHQLSRIEREPISAH